MMGMCRTLRYGSVVIALAGAAAGMTSSAAGAAASRGAAASGVVAANDAPVFRPMRAGGRLDLRAAISPDAPAQGDAALGEGAALVLEMDGGVVAAMEAASRARVDLPMPDGGSVIVEVERFEVLTPDAQVIAMTDKGPQALARPNVQLWRGVVEGQAGSRVFLGLGPAGTQGFVVMPERTISIATAARGELAGLTLATDVGAMSRVREALAAERPGYRRSLLAEAFRCGGAVVEPGTYIPPTDTGAAAPARGDRGVTGDCRAIRVAVDADQEFTQTRFGGNATASSAYITTLMAAVSTIYRADTDVQVLVPFLRTWTTTDPYTQPNTATQLPEFRTYWQANRPTTPHDLAHLLSARSLGGGIAYLSGLCSNNNGYGVSANLNGSFPLPARDFNAGNWDLYVTAHELGHNFSSGHTHESAAYNPIVDGCGNGDCTAATQGLGTIMSYCHQCSGGVANIDLTFGPRPSTRVRNYTYTTVPACGLTLGTPTIVSVVGPTGAACRNGQVTIAATAGSSSVPLTYAWFRGTTRLLATTPSITVFLNASAPGEYRVEVSNGCQTVASAPVTVAICVGDYNCSGGQPTTQDIFDFLTGFFAGESAADINASGGVSTQDLFDFLSVYFLGC